MNTKVCTCCGSFGAPKKQAQGSMVLELVLWCMFIAPGFLYSIWRTFTKRLVCRSCGSTDLVPPNSLMGQKILKELRSHAKGAA